MNSAIRFGKWAGTVCGALLVIGWALPSADPRMLDALSAADDQLMLAMAAQSGSVLNAIVLLVTGLTMGVGAWVLSPQNRWIAFTAALVVMIAAIVYPAVTGSGSPAVVDVINHVKYVPQGWSWWAAGGIGILALIVALRIVSVVPSMVVPQFVGFALGLWLLVLTFLPLIPLHFTVWPGLYNCTDRELQLAWIDSLLRDVVHISPLRYGLIEVAGRRFVPMLAIVTVGIAALGALAIPFLKKHRRALAMTGLWSVGLVAFTMPLGMLINYGTSGMKMADLGRLLKSFTLWYGLALLVMLPVLDMVLTRWAGGQAGTFRADSVQAREDDELPA